MSSRKGLDLVFSLTKGDFTVQTFRAGGKGGQHQNKTDSGVRLIHEPSGARGESREERSQLQNKRIALKKLVARPEFIFWVHEHVREIDGLKSAEQWAEAELANHDNLKLEVKQDGKWVEVNWWDITSA